MIMMPYSWCWSSLQLTGQADFWHPTGSAAPRPAGRARARHKPPGRRAGARRGDAGRHSLQTSRHLQFPCANRAAAAACCASLGSGATLTGHGPARRMPRRPRAPTRAPLGPRPSGPLASAPVRPLRRSRALCRGPLHYADHHGDLIVLVDSDPGMGIVWGTEGAQEREVLLKLGQGRAVSKGLLDSACVLVLGSHRHHLRGIERVHERGPPDPRARRRAMRVGTSCTPRRRTDRDERPDKDLTLICSRSARAWCGSGASSASTVITSSGHR